jgi:hypothetical protein
MGRLSEAAFKANSSVLKTSKLLKANASIRTIPSAPFFI